MVKNVPEVCPAELSEVSGYNIRCFSSSGGSAVPALDIAIPVLAWLGVFVLSAWNPEERYINDVNFAFLLSPTPFSKEFPYQFLMWYYSSFSYPRKFIPPNSVKENMDEFLEYCKSRLELSLLWSSREGYLVYFSKVEGK